MKKMICLILCGIFLLPYVCTFAEENHTLTRIDAVKIIAETLGYTEKEYVCPFTDVGEEDKNIVGYAFEKGWIKGVGENMFNPDAVMTRECFLTIVLRSLKYTDPISFECNNPYDRAFIAGIYSRGQEGDLTKEEARDILEKRKSAYSLYSAKKSDGSYVGSLSFVSSQTGKLEHLFDLDECTVVIGYVTGTPHGSAPRGSVVFKDSGEVLNLVLPRINPWKCAMAENVEISEDGTKLYYTCTIEKDYIGMDGVTLVQKAGVFEYSVDLVERTTEVKKVEKN